jgi:hypothetical protein
VNLLIDNRAALAGEPGVHALIIGVSRYPFLANGDTPVADPWALGQLTSAASSAHAMFEWLKKARLPVPLATCRVLLSPSASPNEAPLNGLTDEATFDNVFQAAHDWRQDASQHQSNITVFYFAGHGVQRDKEDAVLCLHDFRQPPATAPALRRAIDLTTMRAGLSPSSSQPEIARQQFYFIDACREQREQTRNFRDLKTGDLWDIELDGQDDRCSAIFYASISNQVAAATPGGQTLFNQALLACLNGEAGDSLGEDAAGEPIWGVTVESLNKALLSKIDEINRDVGGDQTYTTGGQFKPAQVCLFDKPPLVDVTLEVDPMQASLLSHVTITDNNQVKKSYLPPLVHPIQDTFDAGLYSVALSFTPPAPPYIDCTRLREAHAPRSNWKVRVVV